MNGQRIVKLIIRECPAYGVPSVRESKSFSARPLLRVTTCERVITAVVGCLGYSLSSFWRSFH